ncbi:hypothetical protein NE237_033319 [Protea cynaroides]|uniref:Uncharacterized protein n=1 Tax=Protea cynaroides TaxID=273540 RepID=A0A9Q0JTN6_9MAGN|nr:hypothetical protein NE237_033319 [Protea cynaroides]
MAENLIRYDRMMKIPKVDIGISYLDEMKNKSIISESEDSCQISDAFHELAKFVSGKECVTINDGDDKTNSHVTSSLRHLSFYCQDNMSKGFVLQGTCEDLDRCDNLATCKGLRTLLLQTARSSRISEISFKKITNFKRLRVLDISFTSITEVSEFIGCLVLLQYLNLSKSGIRKLPKTIQKLGRLLILKLNDCRNLKNLPCLEGLCSLQLLLLNKNHYLDSMPPGIGQLTSLETFSCPFVVGKGNEDKIGVLKEMNNLRGSLCISKLENVLNFREASEAALGDKEFLHQLKLKWSVDSFGECKNFQEVLGGLIPHKNLKILKISGYDDQYFPDWVTRETFENLEKVSLSECKKCELLPPLWRLPLLKSLSIIAMEIRQFNNKFFFEIGSGSGFSSLEILQVKEMPNLTCWIIEQGDNIECHPFPKLKELTFVDCPNLRNLEVLQRIESLRLLKIKNCPLNEWMEQQLGWHRGMLDDASMIQNYHRNVEESQEP